MLSKTGLFTLAAIAWCIGGCTPPSAHEALKETLNTTFESESYNYTSSIRMTKLSLPDATEERKADASRVYIDKGTDLLRAVTLSTRGAVDGARAKSEAVYDLQYSQNNVELSIKLPLLADYENRKLYLGKSFINTIFPTSAEHEGKMIRFDLNDTLMQDVFDPKLFNAESFRSIDRAMKEGVKSAFGDLNASLVAYGENTDTKRIRVELDHNRSIEWFVRLADTILSRLHMDGIVSQEEYGAYLIVSDKKRLIPLLEGFAVGTVFDFTLDASGRISNVKTAIHIAEQGGAFSVGFENVVVFERYGEPLFTMNPEETGCVDFKEVSRDWESLLAPAEELEKIIKEPAGVNDSLG